MFLSSSFIIPSLILIGHIHPDTDPDCIICITYSYNVNMHKCGQMCVFL